MIKQEKKVLDLIESFKLLKDFLIAKYKIIENEKDLEKINEQNFKFPVYLKVSSAKHKLKLGGVAKCQNKKQLEKEFKKMKTKFKNKNFIIQEEVKGQEMIIGIITDEVFGKMLMLGIGGNQVEETKNVSFRTAPTNKQEIKKMLKDLKNYNRTINEDKLILLAEKISKLNVKEMDLNPVIVNNKQAVIVDARIVI